MGKETIMATYFEVLYSKYNKTTLTKQEVMKELGLEENQEQSFSRAFQNKRIKITYTKVGRQKLFSLKSFAEYLDASAKVCNI